MTRAERLVVAHPLSPVYARPFIEILAGDQTAAEAFEATVALLSGLGKHVVGFGAKCPDTWSTV
jgi:3-hydroxyacyl-CoA dehydrogenase